MFRIATVLATAPATVLALGLAIVAQPARAAEFRTTQCAKYGHPEIVFEVKSTSIPESDRQWLIDSLEQMVATGSRFKAGETLQLGWMLTRFQNTADGLLRLEEPDMVSRPPIEFVNRVDSTLRHMRSQKDTAESFPEALPLKFPSIRDFAIVPPRLDTLRGFSLERHPSKEPGDSGWVMLAPGAGEEELASYEKLSLHELARSRPGIVSMLALPPGIVVQVADDGQRTFSFDGKPLTVRPDSFVAVSDAHFRLQSYHQRMAEHLMTFWEQPKDMESGTSCTGVLKLARSGDIIGLELEECPDDKALRKSIEKAIKRASPVPAANNAADYREAVSVVFKSDFEFPNRAASTRAANASGDGKSGNAKPSSPGASSELGFTLGEALDIKDRRFTRFESANMAFPFYRTPTAQDHAPFENGAPLEIGITPKSHLIFQLTAKRAYDSHEACLAQLQPLVTQAESRLGGTATRSEVVKHWIAYKLQTGTVQRTFSCVDKRLELFVNDRSIGVRGLLE